MQVFPLSRRALGCAALLTSTGALAASGPARAQEPTATSKPRPTITMTLDSPLARPSGDSRGSLSSDDRLNVGVNPDGTPGRLIDVVARFGRWFPIAVNLDNVGDDAELTLSMHLESSDPSRSGSVSSFETRVQLPRGSSKRVWIYGRQERGGYNIGEVSLSGRGVASLSRTFALSAPSDNSKVMWTISDSGERLKSISSLPQLAANATSSSSVRLYAQSGGGPSVETLGATHDMVPDRWIGLDSVNLVVLRDFSQSALSDAQLNALRGYVASGGSLLITGATEGVGLATSAGFLSDMLPVSPSSTRQITSAQKDALASLLRGELYRFNALKLHGKPVELPSNLGGSRTMTSVDELEDQSLPLVTGTLSPLARPLSSKLGPEMASVRRYGAGRVVWLAFDPASPVITNWRGQEALWKPLLSNLGTPRRIAGVDSSMANQYDQYGSSSMDTVLSSLRASLSRSPQLRTPAASSIAWFLALYVFFLVPVNFVVLRSVDRRELAWVTVPVIVLAFSTLSYAAAVRIKGTELRARQVAVVQGSDASPQARADSMLWVFSPRKSSYSIEGRDAAGAPDASMVSAVYADGRRSDALDNSLVREDGGAGLSVDSAPINMWDYKSFVGQTIVPSGGGFVLKKEGSKRFLLNSSGQALKAAAWIENGRVFSLPGDMAPGARVELPAVLTPGAANGGGLSAIAKMAAPAYSFDNADTGRDIATAALSVAGVDASKHADGVYPPPTLVAWQQKPVSSLSISGEAPVRESVTMWLWRFTK